MTPTAKFAVGLAASLVAGWLYHGPAGNGERLVGALETRAKAAVAKEGVPGVEVVLGRDPLSRTATLSGPADQLQRDGLGSLPGLTDIVAGIEGISAVKWSNPPPAAIEGPR